MLDKVMANAYLAREKIIWNFDNVQKAYATRGYEAKPIWRESDLM
jgi:hypothetical protein